MEFEKQCFIFCPLPSPASNISLYLKYYYLKLKIYDFKRFVNTRSVPALLSYNSNKSFTCGQPHSVPIDLIIVPIHHETYMTGDYDGSMKSS